MRCLMAVVLVLSPLMAQAGSSAAEKVQGRFFAGHLYSQPTDFNAQMSTVGLTDFGALDKVGVEATYGLFDLLDIGLRFSINTASDTLKSNPASTNYWTSIHQEAFQVVAHVPVFKRSFFKFDLVGGYGASNTTVTVNSQTQNGHLMHTGLSGFSDAPVYNYGASLAVGFKGSYIFVESGQESNKVTGFSRDGNLNSSIDSIDLSGAYWIVGIHYDGTMSGLTGASK